ncbi:hypothetical protein DIPPA_27641 [Diplonema papillatum]|nr:hypothetical protein DIPPA_27641 [Diplonema papillatum]
MDRHRGFLPCELPLGVSTGADLLQQLGWDSTRGRSLAPRRREHEASKKYTPSASPAARRALVANRGHVALPRPLRSRGRTVGHDEPCPLTLRNVPRLADAVPGGEIANATSGNPSQPKRRPALLRALEQMLEDELPSATCGEDVHRVHENVFTLFLEGFPTYAAVLGRVKDAYDERVTAAAVLEERLKELERTLGSCDMRAAQALAQNEQACKARVGKALVSANEWRRAYEEAAQQAQTLKRERDEVAEENAELAKTCKKLEADKARYISSLAFLTEICDDLNVKLKAQSVPAAVLEERVKELERTLGSCDMRAAQALAQNEQACKARVGKALVSANEWRRAYEEAAQQAQTLKCERDEVAEENAELAKTCKKLEADKARYISSLAFLTEICDDLNVKLKAQSVPGAG